MFGCKDEELKARVKKFSRPRMWIQFTFIFVGIMVTMPLTKHLDSSLPWLFGGGMMGLGMYLTRILPEKRSALLLAKLVVLPAIASTLAVALMNKIWP